jgi:hypothetical protein
MQQQTMNEVMDIKQRLDSENERRQAAEKELQELRSQVRDEQRKRRHVEKKFKKQTHALLTGRNHLHNSALSMLQKRDQPKTERKQYGQW